MFTLNHKFIGVLLVGFASNVFSTDSLITNVGHAEPSSEKSGKGNIAKERLIDSILSVSGMKISLRNMSEQIVAGGTQSFDKNEAPEEIKAKIKAIYEDAFPPDLFINSATIAMRDNFDQQRYSHVLLLLSSPLARRMADLEAQKPSLQEMQTYVLGLAKNPLSAKRKSQIKEIDAASGASDLMTQVYMSSIKASAFGVLGDCPEARSNFEKALANRLRTIKTAIQKDMQITMARTYKDVSDRDMDDYIKIYNSPDAMWVQRIVQKVIKDQSEIGATKVGQAVGMLVHGKSDKSMFTPKCPSLKTTPPTTQPTENSLDKLATISSRSNLDARECLKYDHPAKIRACAEKFR